MTKSPDTSKPRRLRLKAPETVRISDRIVALMRNEEGASAADLAAAVGWQVHSVRGFISGTLKKRVDVEVLTSKGEGATRYRVVDRA